MGTARTMEVLVEERRLAMVARLTPCSSVTNQSVPSSRRVSVRYLTGVGNCESFATHRESLDYQSSKPLIGELVLARPNYPNPYSELTPTVKRDVLVRSCSMFLRRCSGVGGAP